MGVTRKHLNARLGDETWDALEMIRQRSRTTNNQVALVETIILQFADMAVRFSRQEWDSFTERFLKIDNERKHSMR